MSQLLLRIENELKTTANPILRGKLLAKRAGYFARIGKFAEARSIVNDLRSDFAEEKSGSVTTWIMLAEGLIHYYDKLNSEALDRVSRVQVLSKAMGDVELVAVASAWKAHFEFERSNFQTMSKSLEIALQFGGQDNHSALSRASMVLCDCHFLCGDRNNGQKWFLKSRDHALKDGDQASIEALLYNRVAFYLAWVRARNCFDKISSDQLSLIRFELSSAKSFQNITRISALQNIIDLCDARLLTLEEKYEQAIDKLQSLRDISPYGEYNFNQSFVDLEIDFCSHEIGRDEKHSSDRSNDKFEFFDKMDIDEQLIAAWMIYKIERCSSNLKTSSIALNRLEEIKLKYIESVLQLQNILIRFSSA